LGGEEEREREAFKGNIMSLLNELVDSIILTGIHDLSTIKIDDREGDNWTLTFICKAGTRRGMGFAIPADETIGEFKAKLVKEVGLRQAQEKGTTE
jgi:hypothetical protein